MRYVSFVLFVLLVVMSVAGVAAEKMQVGQWYETGITMPVGKPGGGEYFVVVLDEPGVEHEVVDGTIRLRFAEIGEKNVPVTIRRIEKTSCAGASARDVVNDTVEITVVPIQ